MTIKPELLDELLAGCKGLRLSRTKSFLFITESTLILLSIYVISGYFLAPKFVAMLPGIPGITIFLIFAVIPPALASIYLRIRYQFIPKITINRQLLVNTFPFLIASFVVVITGVMFMGNADVVADDVLSINNRYFFYFTLFLLHVIAPFLEEVFFRGYFFEIMREKSGIALSMTYCSILFVLAHDIFGGIGINHLFLFIHSLVFTAAYMQCGLIGSTLAHIFVNSYLTFVFAG